jgi:alkanesulfonate monooxygenase SsuD/methylene tetrahydromethanopterin reductase-like flavin-dependent oxidoreductase (luciferase family)
MRFGVFDHIDESGLTVGRQFQERLALIERYERAGFHAYHVAEHHNTPLGHAPSPSVFLAAATQRTTTLRLGPLVYCLPLYHPLRLIDEVCMLDHLSGGRLQLGVGAGVSPVEVGFYDVDWDSRRDRFEEAFEILLKGLSSEDLTHHGERYRFDAVPMNLAPVQKPHPPLWFGISRPERAAWAAEHEVNTVALLPPAMVRPITDQYRAEWAARGRPAEDIPLMGVSRLIVVAETDDAAMATARRAYRPWFQSLNHLWRKYDVPSPLDGVLPEDFADWHDMRGGFAGTPEAAREYIAAEIEEAGINYFCADLAFGDITFDEAARTADLFAAEIVPAFDTVGAN